jgi:hypothetical protein
MPASHARGKGGIGGAAVERVWSRTPNFGEVLPSWGFARQNGAMRPTAHLRFCLALSAASATGCAPDGVPFHLLSGPEFAEADRTISVFGLFKDGELTAETQTSLGPTPWSFLGGNGCDVAYAALAGKSPTLAKTVDGYAKNNGITDDLLAVFAPAAKGAMIMSVIVAGHVTVDDAGTETTPAPPPPSSPSPGHGGGHGHRGGGTMPSRSTRERSADRGAIELSASFYAVGAQRSVAIAETRYVGSSPEAAWKTFSTKLAAAMPGATCRGWSLDAHLDTNSLQRLLETNTASSREE